MADDVLGVDVVDSLGCWLGACLDDGAENIREGDDRDGPEEERERDSGRGQMG